MQEEKPIISIVGEKSNHATVLPVTRENLELIVIF
jgi:hypothetical protein